MATNIGCWRWKGTASFVHVNKRFDTHTATAEVTFERYRTPGYPDGMQNVESYKVVEGTATWQVTTSPGADCTYVGGPLKVPLVWSDGDMTVHTIAQSTRRLYRGAGSVSFDSSYDVICQGGTLTRPWNNAMWFATNLQDPKYVSSDGLTMSGSTTLLNGDQDLWTSQWHFTAQREP